MKSLLSIVIMAVVWPPVGAWAGDTQAARDDPTFEYQGLVSHDDVQAGERQATETAAVSSLSSENRAAVLNARAVYRFFLAKYKEAVQDLDEAISLAPQSAYYANRGIMHRMQGDWDRAREDYEEALKIDERNAFAHNNLGWLTLLESQKLAPGKDRAEKVSRAKEHFREAVQCQSDGDLRLPLAQVNLAAACIADGELDAARRSLQAIQGQSMFPWARQCALLNQGELARCDGKWAEALKLYEAAYQKGKPRNVPPPPAALSRARWNEANENPWILQRLGAAQLVLGQHKQAGRNLAKAAERFGSDCIAGRYAALLAALANAHQNDRKTIYSERKDDKPKRWVDALEMYLAGRLSERSLKSAARDSNVKAQQAKQCEMAYYVGQKKLLEGDAQEARASFRECVRVPQPRRLERTMAMHELSKSGKKD